MRRDAETAKPARGRSWLGVAAATVIAVAAWVGYWWLAVPRFDVCAAILPAPAGCGGAARVATATLWTAVIAVLLLATAAAALIRPRGRWWPFAVAIAVLGVTALWGFWAVRYAGG
ncbi:hypothetical protein [Micromonospora parathelypteridis]|uniref:Transmembrane protein n=1 Tax=Micromonospora parathelypteridis TaxID=1839617 RepID=A0A840VV58_9ACTN|nr:hypothetical protein [Micromonospora parathelypteridis]MBB5476888.1 hypothetical protein [Micromonospora parathelypteridis]